ncbi:alcohol dehydrogenase catalytic domain-containing protein [Rhodococcus chondri]|uniref:Alcohol dehydrogenase catalytic domain-containing protein n=1 Tax=Rhodococcus chondri TaxID=3065941 RepID=A0ABU7JYY2_9NOCA|nr:alcohol dehydrogenase catalytic domain-containing protein [Rhodococcus sp. CC-R104]MEE2035110.1 alcohol dehydrogenase catalytic domain-containing protein [Rhodococcus sp. CC-R104]
MPALTVEPGRTDSLRVEQIPDPTGRPGQLLVQGLALGICGTDREIARGDYGSAPPGRDRLVLGHESLGRFLEAPAESGFSEGDLVVGVVRRPDPQPCGACAHGEFDMCRNGRYRERGITCLTGISAAGRTIDFDAGALNRSIVLENDVVIGSVNANLRHYRAAADALAAADTGWLEAMITRRVPLDRAFDAFDVHPEDVKVVLDLEAARP